MFDDFPREDVVAAVDRLVDELLRAAHIEQPPVDAIRLAQKHLGMIICMDSRQQQRGRAQRATGVRQIYLRPEPREERHQWTVAHEIGEHFKSELLARLGVEPSATRAMAGESLANLFAYRLLVPTCWFSPDARVFDYDLAALKERYSTSSNEVLAWRFLDLPEPCIVTVIDKDSISRRRSNSWPIKRKLEPAEQKCQRLVHQSGRARVLRENGWTVQGWPVHEADWKREILRSVVEVD